MKKLWRLSLSALLIMAVLIGATAEMLPQNGMEVFSAPCEHERSELVEYDVIDYSVEVDKISDVSQYHLKIIQPWIASECLDCDTRFSGRPNGDSTVEEERHTYNSNGECTICGYVDPAHAVAPTSMPTPAPTAARISKPTSSPMVARISKLTPSPTAAHTATPAPVATAVPTAEPTVGPTATPVPVAEPTPVPSAALTPVPSAKPSPIPTAEPTAIPSAKPTPAPTASPTPKPTKDLQIKKNATKKLAAGDKLQIIVDGKKVKSYKSGNTDVATVSKKGVVKAKYAGTAKITVTLSNNKTLTLTVKVSDAKAPKKVSITKGKSAKLKVGKKLALKAKLTPADARTKLTWKSSNTKVATVSSKGVVKAKKVGSAKITVTATNGKKATITIKVKK